MPSFEAERHSQYHIKGSVFQSTHTYSQYSWFIHTCPVWIELRLALHLYVCCLDVWNYNVAADSQHAGALQQLQGCGRQLHASLAHHRQCRRVQVLGMLSKNHNIEPLRWVEFNSFLKGNISIFNLVKNAAKCISPPILAVLFICVVIQYRDKVWAPIRRCLRSSLGYRHVGKLMCIHLLLSATPVKAGRASQHP